MSFRACLYVEGWIASAKDEVWIVCTRSGCRLLQCIFVDVEDRSVAEIEQHRQESDPRRTSRPSSRVRRPAWVWSTSHRLTPQEWDRSISVAATFFVGFVVKIVLLGKA